MELLDIPKLGEEHAKDVLYKETRPTGERRYELTKEIGGLTYNFVLFDSWGMYKIKFKTLEYDYAVTQGSPESLEEIFRTIKEVVDLAKTDDPSITKISIEAATHEYSVAEIEACKAEMLSKNPMLIKEDLDELKGFEVLRTYTYDEDHGNFPLGREQVKSTERRRKTPHELRARLFRIYLKKYFPEWSIEQNDRSSDFVLVAPGAG